jgi:hypothetical protein
MSAVCKSCGVGMQVPRSHLRACGSAPRQRSTLAACLAVALGLGSADPLQATTTYVNSCADIGTHPKGVVALRYAVISAGDGDIIDLSALNCSVITLNAANIPVSVNNLTIQSSAANPITIDGAHASRVFNHSGTGYLELRYVTIENGNGNFGPEGNDNNRGGCILSGGEIYLDHTTVQGCTARTGGGTSSVGPTILTNSTVTGNSAGNLAYTAVGGGIYAGGAVTIANSTLSNNQSESIAGGIRAWGKLTISHSTISGNTGPSCAIDALSGTLSALEVSYSTFERNGSGPGAALCISKTPLSSSMYSSIRYSTFDANAGAAAVFVASSGGFTNHLAVYNSTISGSVGNGITCSGCGLVLVGSTVAFNGNIGVAVSSPGAVLMVDSIFANSPSDLVIGAGASITSGSHSDLVVKGNVVPGDALRDDPHLAPLAFRGGPTRTHALGANSPAIDAGAPVAAVVDQRGSGYVRSVGAGVDIGAYERQANDDELFGSNFD